MSSGFPGLGGAGFDSVSYQPSAITPRIEIRQSRHGVVKAPIDSTHMLRGESGIQQSHTVRDVARFGGVKRHVVCLARECRGKKWETPEACAADHPPHEIMVRQNECHPIAWWSDEPADGALRAELAQLPDEAQRAKALKRAQSEDAALVKQTAPHLRHTLMLATLPIGLMSDVRGE